MQTAYFLSDTHFNNPEEPHYKAALFWLKGLKGREDLTHLFLMGDIFDLWIGRHATFVEKWSALSAELLRLHQRGVEIHYFEGNHDLYIDAFFGSGHLGFNVHPSPVDMDLAGRRVRLEHGDQMDPTDRGYLFLRWFLRTRLMNFVALKLKDKWVRALGEKMSHASRDYTSNRSDAHFESVKAKIAAHVSGLLELKKFDLFIAGHVHHQMDFMVGSTRVINLGSWLGREKPHVLRLSETTLEFQELPAR